jgi:hypothetical protein
MPTLSRRPAHPHPAILAGPLGETLRNVGLGQEATGWLAGRRWAALTHRGTAQPACGFTWPLGQTPERSLN